jgi:hypothetical protein
MVACGCVRLTKDLNITAKTNNGGLRLWEIDKGLNKTAKTNNGGLQLWEIGKEPKQNSQNEQWWPVGDLPWFKL